LPGCPDGGERRPKFPCWFHRSYKLVSTSMTQQIGFRPAGRRGIRVISSAGCRGGLRCSAHSAQWLARSRRQPAGPCLRVMAFASCQPPEGLQIVKLEGTRRPPPSRPGDSPAGRAADSISLKLAEWSPVFVSLNYTKKKARGQQAPVCAPGALAAGHGGAVRPRSCRSRVVGALNDRENHVGPSKPPAGAGDFRSGLLGFFHGRWRLAGM